MITGGNEPFRDWLTSSYTHNLLCTSHERREKIEKSWPTKRTESTFGPANSACNFCWKTGSMVSLLWGIITSKAFAHLGSNRQKLQDNYDIDLSFPAEKKETYFPRVRKMHKLFLQVFRRKVTLPSNTSRVQRQGFQHCLHLIRGLRARVLRHLSRSLFSSLLDSWAKQPNRDVGTSTGCFGCNKVWLEKFHSLQFLKTKFRKPSNEVYPSWSWFKFLHHGHSTPHPTPPSSRSLRRPFASDTPPRNLPAPAAQNHLLSRLLCLDNLLLCPKKKPDTPNKKKCSSSLFS